MIDKDDVSKKKSVDDKQESLADKIFGLAWFVAWAVVMYFSFFHRQVPAAWREPAAALGWVGVYLFLACLMFVLKYIFKNERVKRKSFGLAVLLSGFSFFYFALYLIRNIYLDQTLVGRLG